MAVPCVHANQASCTILVVASLAEVSILVCQHLTLVSLEVKAGKLHPAYTKCEQSLHTNSSE